MPRYYEYTRSLPHLSSLLSSLLFSSLSSPPSLLLSCLFVRLICSSSFSFFYLHLVFVAIPWPEEWLDGHEATRRRVWLLALLLQLGLFQRILSRWMFSTDGHLEQARAPYLLSTVGWFLLCVLGTNLGLTKEWCDIANRTC